MSVLVPCPGCSRHVRSAEAACPFCQKDLPTNLASSAVPAARRRMDRFATFTFAAALAVGASGVACSGADDRTDQQEQQSDDELRKKKKKDAAPDVEDAGCRQAEDPGAIIAMYGMPPGPIDDRPICEPDAGEDAGGVVALYGMPPGPIDEEDGGGIQPMYGMPAGND